MSHDGQPQAAWTDALGPTLPWHENAYDPDPDRDPPKPTDVRDIVRLFQCRICSLPLREPVRLACGRSICRQCIPETHLRENITYPATADRQHGFRCPFSECRKEHVVRDCNVDVALNKAVEYIKEAVEHGKADAANSGSSTYVLIQNAWDVAGVGSLADDDEDRSHAVNGGKLVATYWLAEEGLLKYEADVSYQDASTASGREPVIFDDMDVLKRAQEKIRPEMDCQVCYGLLYDPLTTACGHTLCRSCLHRILDHSRHCPVCRRPLRLNPLLDRVTCPSNEALVNMIETFWLDEVLVRKATLAAEAASRVEVFDTPLFICTLSFPQMPTYLHIFEPRYRLMMRRALLNNRIFGMVLPRHPPGPDGMPFYPTGTLLRILDISYFPDGRFLMETVGLTRFRVLRYSVIDDYAVAQTERIDDLGLEDEEAAEALEVMRHREGQDGQAGGVNPQPAPVGFELTPYTVEDLEFLPTNELVRYARSFVNVMRHERAPWLAEKTLRIYGEHPEDPALFPWWFASTLPIDLREKYRLLNTSSVRGRLKICCSWVVAAEYARVHQQPPCTIL